MKTADDRAVSQNIGIILMIAITATTAAIAAAAILSFAEMKRMYIVAFTVEEVNESHVKVKYNGGPDHAYLSQCNGIIDGTEVGSVRITVGAITEIEHGKSGAFNFAIVCRFADDSTQIVYSSRLYPRIPNP